MKKNLKKITILLIILCSIITTGTSLVTKTPQKVYRVYLKGDSLGIIKSKTELEDYINEKQIEIKKKYNVDKVYIPSDLDIVKEVTFNNNITSVKSIYNKFLKSGNKILNINKGHTEPLVQIEGYLYSLFLVLVSGL